MVQRTHRKKALQGLLPVNHIVIISNATIHSTHHGDPLKNIKTANVQTWVFSLETCKKKTWHAWRKIWLVGVKKYQKLENIACQMLLLCDSNSKMPSPAEGRAIFPRFFSAFTALGHRLKTNASFLYRYQVRNPLINTIATMVDNKKDTFGVFFEKKD